MKNEVILKKDAEVVNLDDFRKGLATGGPIGPEDWLSELKEGSVFVAKMNRIQRPKTYTIQDNMLDLFFLQQKKETVSNVIYKFPDDRQLDIWVKNLDFSRTYDLVEVLAEVELIHRTPEEQEAFVKKMEDKDGTSNRTVRPGRLLDNEASQGGHSGDESA